MVLAPGFAGVDEGRAYDLAGVFAGEARMPARRMLGYVVGTSAAMSPTGQAAFRGHEFHYSDVRLLPGTRYAYRLTRGSGIRDGLDGALRDRTIGSYTHLHPVTSRGMLAHFVDCCRGELSPFFRHGSTRTAPAAAATMGRSKASGDMKRKAY